MLICFIIYLATVNLLAIGVTVHDKNVSRMNAAHRRIVRINGSRMNAARKNAVCINDFHENNVRKNASLKNIRRVKECTLLVLCILGGSAAMLLTMLVVRHKTRSVKFMVGIPLIIILQTAIIATALDQRLSVSNYDIYTDKISRQIILALVTDLHSCGYGDGQRELLVAIDAHQPDVILLCGDIFDDKLPPDNAIKFIEAVSKAYPCYYVSGNHEFWSGKADAFKKILTSYGVKILEGTTELLEARGGNIQIAGIDDPDTDYYTSRSIPYTKQIEQLGAYSDNETFMLLLSHRPERIEQLLPLNPDLVLSGHAHGGQWRIPLILENGLLSPNQGLFPKFADGEHIVGDTTMIISRGLARETTAVPRIFNRPEIVVVTLNGNGAADD